MLFEYNCYLSQYKTHLLSQICVQNEPSLCYPVMSLISFQLCANLIIHRFTLMLLNSHIISITIEMITHVYINIPCIRLRRNQQMIQNLNLDIPLKDRIKQKYSIWIFSKSIQYYNDWYLVICVPLFFYKLIETPAPFSKLTIGSSIIINKF